MAEQITIKVPDFNNSGLTEEVQEQLRRFLQELKDQTNSAIQDHEQRITALEP